MGKTINVIVISIMHGENNQCHCYQYNAWGKQSMSLSSFVVAIIAIVAAVVVVRKASMSFQLDNSVEITSVCCWIPLENWMDDLVGGGYRVVCA
jgi:hypothetical protein